MGSQKLLRRQFAGGNSLRKQWAMVSFAHVKDPASNDYPVSQPQFHCGPSRTAAQKNSGTSQWRECSEHIGRHTFHKDWSKNVLNWTSPGNRMVSHLGVDACFTFNYVMRFDCVRLWARLLSWKGLRQDGRDWWSKAQLQELETLRLSCSVLIA
jgi:hypothetical protein